MSKSGIINTIKLMKDLPRVSLGNLKPLDGTLKKKKTKRGKHAYSKQSKAWHTDGRQMFPIGVTTENKNPFYMTVPKEDYYKNYLYFIKYKKIIIQRLIDLGRINPSEQIDLTTLCNTKIIKIDTDKNHYGIDLTDEGCDRFASKIDIEVQYTNQIAIASIEKLGGTIITRYFDKMCVDAMQNPSRFFERGVPIHRCKLPSSDSAEYYCDAANRGYLAEEKCIVQDRLQCAQKYGYELKKHHFSFNLKKSPRQIWINLQPGWVIDVNNKTILKPTDEKLLEYYEN